MTRQRSLQKAVLMIAYTNYRTDPRVIRAAEAAVSAGFAVDFLTLRREGESDEESINGVRVLRLNQLRYRGSNVLAYVLSYLQFFVRCTIRAAVLHFRRRYVLVHVNNMPDFFVFCAIVAKLMGAKVLLDIHDPMPNTFASKFKSGDRGLLFRVLLWQEKISAWFADRVLTVHEPLKEYVLVAQHGLPADRIDVVANFADDRLFVETASDDENQSVRLVFHGSILERYGLQHAMKALSEMRYRDKVSVKIIGEGDYSARLKDLIQSLGLEATVRFDNRMYPLDQIPAQLKGSNLGLVPLEISSITKYALPLKLLEYLSLGIASITVRNEAIAYYFDEDDCLFYEPNNVDSLREVLERVASTPDVLRRYQQRARELRGKFLWSNEKRKYIHLLETLTA